MTVDLHGLPIFYGNFEPERPTRFDREMYDCTRAYAPEMGHITGICDVAGEEEARFRISSDNLREDVAAKGSGTINRHR